MDTNSSYKTIIRFNQPAVQVDGPIKRVVGFVRGKHMLPLFDNATLDANPRSAKVNNVTADIIESLNDAADIFQFKTKGILLGSASYRELERSRFELTLNNPEYEGLLDGGHNMLAIGTYLLSQILDDKTVRTIKRWDDLMREWKANRHGIEAIKSEISFKVPVELLVPSDAEDKLVLDEFKMALIDVCAARNNNSQLTTEAKANQRGFYDEIRKRLPEELADRVEWKTNYWERNDIRPIKVRNIVALAWIPLSVLNDSGKLPTQSAKERPLNFDISPQRLYSSKNTVSKQFDLLMEHPEVSKPKAGRHELHRVDIGSAFDILAELPALFDKVFLMFPQAYNASTKGSFGGIKAVKYTPRKKSFSSPFFTGMSEYDVPEGFVMPVVYGLKKLIRFEGKTLEWIVDPDNFLDKNLEAIIGSFSILMKVADFDPQKVGKNANCYLFTQGEVEKALVLSQN